MKYHIQYPDGSEVEFEVQPLSSEKFSAVCVTICFVLFIVGLFAAIILR